MRVSNIVVRPIVTEKSMAKEPESRYTFEVNMRASKGSVADAMKRIYGVDAIEVRTMVMPGKKRRIIGTRRFTKTKKWKKAVIKLKEGQKIEMMGK